MGLIGRAAMVRLKVFASTAMTRLSNSLLISKPASDGSLSRSATVPERYAYIDAIRGYAILLVIAVHSSQYFDNLPSVVRTLADQGSRGVQLFFVASAITLCMSWRARHDGAIPFYIRRFFRIAPMYYLSIPLFLWVRGFGPSIYAPDGIGWRHIAMAATFTHGLMPDTITSVVPGSWSIADEMMFYLIFPLLMFGLSRVRFPGAALAVIVMTWVCLRIQSHANVYVAYMPDPAWRAAWGTFTFLWLVQQLPCFLFGMLAFKWMAGGRPVRWPWALVLVSLLAMPFIAFFPNLPYIGRLGLPMQYGIIFAVFALGLSYWQPRLLVNPAIGWVGKVSFSGYLVHLWVLSTFAIPHSNYAEAFFSLTVITIAISSVTYLVIEGPGNRLGRWVAKRLRKPGARISNEPGRSVIAQEIAIGER
jgi:peptidoglycan/LPS O-acetylase OafA/YrhL